MPITLTITDNEDGTGGTATIAGSTGGSTNVLYRATFDGVRSVINWASAGTRTGDGTITLTGPIRFASLWYVQSTSGSNVSVSSVVLKALTDNTYQAVLTRCMNAIVTRLRQVDFQDFGPDAIVRRNLSDDPVAKWPGIMVVYAPVPASNPGGTHIRDDVGYPIQVLIQDRDKMGPAAESGRLDLWREKAERAIRSQRLDGVPEVMQCVIEPGVAVDMSLRIYEHVVSAFTVRVLTREPRGIQA